MGGFYTKDINISALLSIDKTFLWNFSGGIFMILVFKRI